MGSLLTKSSQVYGKNLNVDDKYIITLAVSASDLGDAFAVSTAMEETLSLSMASDWITPFAKSNMENLSAIMGEGKADLVNKLAQAVGLNARSKAQTVQVWDNSSALSFTIPFTLTAYTDAEKEVRDVVKNLLKLQAPSVKGLMLQAPGPTILSESADSFSGRDVTLQIGTFLTLRHCIIKSVDAQFDAKLNANGTPISAKATVTVESFFTCFTTSDIDDLFKTT
jgi:hypothetical protein